MVLWWWNICQRPAAVRRHSEVRLARLPWFSEVYFSMTRPSASSHPRMFSTLIGSPTGPSPRPLARRPRIAKLAPGGAELVKVGCEQPLKPGRISAALRAQRLMLGSHGLGDLLVSNGRSGGLLHARCSQPMVGLGNRHQAQAKSGVRPPIAAAASSQAQRIRVTAVSG